MPLAHHLMRNSHGGCLVERWWAAWLDLALIAAVWKLIHVAYGVYGFSLPIVAALGFPLLYFPLMECAFGATIGKWLLGIRVVNEIGKPPGFWQAMVRNVLRVFEINPFLLGGLIAGLVAVVTKYNQRVGDLLAKTYVVRRTHLLHGLNLADAIRQGREFRYPEVHFDEFSATYYVWTSQLGVKYMKHFDKPADAIAYSNNGPADPLTG